MITLHKGFTASNLLLFLPIVFKFQHTLYNVKITCTSITKKNIYFVDNFIIFTILPFLSNNIEHQILKFTKFSM